jgi:ferredoxin
VDGSSRSVTRTAVLVCGRVPAAADPPSVATVVDDLCERPAAAAVALREADADSVVLGLCERHPSGELVAALWRAGAAPFGIETVALGGRPPAEAARLVAGAFAKLVALAPDERGKPVLRQGAVSRRTLLSRDGVVTYAPVAVLDETRCVGTARCSLCIERCPEHAIAETVPLPTIDPGACTACGRCVPGCPQGALRLSGAATPQTGAQLEALTPGVSGIVFACRQAAEVDVPPGWAVVELPTLALLTSGWILQLRARNVDVRLARCGGACCVGASAVEELAGRVLLETAAPRGTRPERIRLTEPSATAEAVQCLAPGSTAVIESEQSPLGLLTLAAERCTLCGACATACPTEALRLDQSAEETVLRLRADACIGCRRCTIACPENALDVRPGIDFAQLRQASVDLLHAPGERCGVCGADLPPRPMRRRLREILPELSGAPLELCARCATTATAPPRAAAGDAARRSHTIAPAG